MNKNNIKITIFKEIRGIIRDKKSLQKLIIYPLIIPIIILLFGFLFDSVNESTYNVGINYSLTEEEKSITNTLDNLSFKTYNNKKELQEAYQEKKIDGYIVKENHTYTIYADESQNSGDFILTYGTAYLESYNQLLGNMQLIQNGLDPEKINNSIVIKTKSLVKEESNILSKTLLNLIVAYLIMIVVMICVVVVTDATSGEKERGTLETILTFPIKSSELVIGKYLATAILSFIGGVIAYFLAIPAFIFGKQMFKSYEEIIFNTDVQSILLVVLVLFLAALLSSGICMALAGKAKSYKEAQSSLQFISLLPIIPYFLNIMEINHIIFNLIPIANCSTLLNDIVVNNINYQSLLIIIFSTIVYICCILLYVSSQYKKEETLFS